MTFSRCLFGFFALLTAMTSAFAAAPATNAPSACATVSKEASAKGKAADKTAATAPSPTAQTPAPTGSKWDAYIKDLTAALKLSDLEKQEVQAYYLEDADQLKKILNDDTLSPLQQARQVSGLRDVRNAKIKVLLDDWQRQYEFLKIEARYRVALIELAANGGLIASPPPPASPAAAPATNAPAAAK